MKPETKKAEDTLKQEETEGKLRETCYSTIFFAKNLK
jgi:hypothetical protein